jgi:hypothetical protein
MCPATADAADRAVFISVTAKNAQATRLT